MKYIIFIIGLLLSAITLTAQTYTMGGTVYDELGPLTGATVHIKEKVTIGAATDENGKFTIKAERGDWLVFRFIGYEQVEYLVTEEKKDLEIRFTESAAQLDEVVVTAMGTQRKISSLAAVTSVDVKELQQPVTSVANLLGGRVAGVISTMTSGEPGKNIAEFWVRGIGTFGANASALVLIDGLEGDINTIDPADIESFSVLKDASATAVYGVRGANGVILVTTKRGITDNIQITGRATFSISHLKKLPKYLRAHDYAKLGNEARSVRGEEPLYTNVEMDIIQNNLDPDMYPDVNWQDEIMKNTSLGQKFYVSARGGAKVARYFISLNGGHEGAAYKVDKNSPYSSNVGYNTYGYRVNVDLSLTPTTEVYFGNDGFLSVQNEPGVANTDYVWAAQAAFNPLLFPVRYSNGQSPAVGVDAGTSPYVMINQMGRRTSQSYKGKATLALNQKLNMITEGLNIRVQGAYDIQSYFYERRTIRPALYEAVSRNQQGELVTIERVASQAAGHGASTNQYRKYHLESTLNYERVFAEDHRASALVYYYMSDEKWADEGLGSNLNSIPKRYQGISSRLTYGFRDTYLVDFNFGYTGSENFEPGHQFGFFPSIAAGWIPTGYELVKEKFPFIDVLKFKASYGTVGNDRLAGDRRFPYLTRVTRMSAYAWGSYPVEGLVESFTGADNLLWEKATKFNVGLETAFLSNKITFNLDFFKDKRDRIFQQRVQVPIYVGLSTMPYSNVGAMESHGADGNFSFDHNFNKNLGFTLRGNFTFSKNNVKAWEEANPKYAYQEISGYPFGPIRGLQALGLFKDQKDIETSPVQTFGEYMPGDIKYKDVNGDGRIDDDDRVPLGFTNNPPMLMYGFGGEFRYKQFSLGVLFKGTGRTDFVHVGWGNELGYIPFADGKMGNVLDFANDPKNRWIPMDYAIANGIDPKLAENPNALFPRLKYGTNSNNQRLSDFWMGDSRYLRLQEVTLNYNLREPFLTRMGIRAIDIQLVGNNLAVWGKVKEFDPEQAASNGRAYPIPSIYTIQLYVHF
ncbi:MAG: TonB-dependent receptor [Prevotella sp.]|nr:TonB-dependent receptor [Prevotella sp.]